MHQRTANCSRENLSGSRRHPGHSASVAIEVPNILIVDDSAIKSEAVRDVIEGCGYHVTVCATPRQALAALAKKEFSFAFVDGNLGDFEFGRHSLSGVLCENLRTRGIRFGRVSSDPSYIPKELHGEICVNAGDRNVVQILENFLQGNFPIAATR